MFQGVMKAAIKPGCLVLVGLISGCGVLTNSTNDHLQAKDMPPLVIPEGMDRQAVGEIYPVPDIQDKAVGDDFVVPRPLPVSANVFEETVKIQSFGGQKWILINQPPAEMWPRVRNILNRSGIPAQQVDASKGFIETTWIQFKNDDSTSHRFRFSIEPAIQINSTEIRILQMKTAVGSEESVQTWPESSDSSGREREMLDIISGALAADISGPSVSLLAQSIGGEEKVSLVTPAAADPYIHVALSYDRAWASLVYSLTRGGFSINDRNQEQGIVSVRFSPESLDAEDEPGLFARWFGFGDEEAQQKSGADYEVLVSKVGNAVQVRIVNPDNTSLDNMLSAKLLKIVRGNLS